jgi:hypothetical protein
MTVRRLQDGDDQSHRGEVNAAVAEPVEQAIEPSRRAGDGDAPVGLGLGEMERLGAVSEHRGKGTLGEESARLDLADVSYEVGLDAAFLVDEFGEAKHQVLVGNRTKRFDLSGWGEVLRFHALNIGSGFRAAQECERCTQRS